MPPNYSKTKAEKLSILSRVGSLSPDDPTNYDISTKSTFIRMVVIDVITDPNVDLKDKEKIERWKNLKITNFETYRRVLPRNSIIAKRVREHGDPMFVFPFFPSHISFPCKPGESVWVMLEDPSSPTPEMAFWVGRVIDAHQSDDVNHSHPAKIYDVKPQKNAKELADSERKGTESSIEWCELRNAPTVTAGEDRFTRGESLVLPGEPEDIFEKLVTESDASAFVSYESVPRFRKRPGDVAFEGTNNTLIVLGTDRNGGLEKTEFDKGSGAIDIVAGRGQSPETFGKAKTVTSFKDAKGKIKGTEIKKELDKEDENLSEEEGNPDFVSDRSRVLVSQKTAPDEYFGLNKLNPALGVSDSAVGDAAVVIKSDKVRLIARSDVQILVTGFSEEKNSAGDTVKKEKTDPSEWGSITINSKGEIIIKPGKSSLLKLGGEDADKAILCSTQLPAGVGEVTGAPITDTMGGNIGVKGSSVTGVYASKVLIK